MKKHWMKWSCMAVLVLTSCQQGNLSEEISTDNLALGLQASIAGEIFSRTSTQEDGHTTFVQGDKIGLLCQKKRMPYYGHWGKAPGSHRYLCSGPIRNMIIAFVLFIRMQRKPNEQAFRCLT